VPTVERGLRVVVFWSIEMAGDRPSIESARVRRQRLDVAALSLGVERVERQAGLAGARESGDDDQSIARQRDRDVLQIVLPGAPDHDLVARHEPPRCGLIKRKHLGF
jgi:hypothetical protein